MTNDAPSTSHADRLATCSLFIVLGICATALSGWVFDSLILASFAASFPPAAPSTAALFIVLTCLLLIHLRVPDYGPAPYIVRLVALLITVMSASFCAGYFIDAVDPSVEGLFTLLTGHGIPVRINRTSPITAGCFTLAAAAVFFLSLERQRPQLRWLSPLLASVTTVGGLVLVVGYLNGSPFLYGGSVRPVALPTAVAFLVFGIALCAVTDPGTVPRRLFEGPSIRSRLMRAFLPVMAAILLLHGLIDARFYARLPNPELVSSLATLLSLFVVGILISKIAKSISRKVELAEREKKLAEDKFSESQELFNSFFENTIEAMLVASPDGTVYSANPEACHIFGMTEHEIRVLGIDGLLEHDEPLKSVLDVHLQGGRARGEVVGIRKDGSRFPAEIATSVFSDRGGRQKTTITLRDITERDRMQRDLKERNEILKFLSDTDPLTRLFNRRYLMESLDREIKRLARTKGHVSLVMFDIDHFKLINDVYGHQLGDTVLVAIADTAQANLRGYEIAARYGGEEFVLVLFDTDLDVGVAVAERLRLAVQGITFKAPMVNLAVTVSVGVATYPAANVDDVDTLIARADEALYRAKRNGRNRVESMTIG